MSELVERWFAISGGFSAVERDDEGFYESEREVRVFSVRE